MSPDRLLLVAAAYHLVVGLVLALLPGDLFRYLALPPPRYWGLYYLVAAGPLALGLGLLAAGRRPRWRDGLLVGAAFADVVGGLILFTFVLLFELPRVLLGPAVAAGLWAWLIWGILAPEMERPSPDGASGTAPEDP